MARRDDSFTSTSIEFPASPPPDWTRLGQFRRMIVRWGTVAIAASMTLQTGTTLFKSLVLPTFSRQIAQAQGGSAWLKISAMNQAQQVYFLDHGQFSQDLGLFDLGLGSQGEYYDYRIQPVGLIRSSRRTAALLPPTHSQPQPHQVLGQAEPEQVEPTLPLEMAVNLALPRQPGLPVFWGAIAVQAAPETAPQGQTSPQTTRHKGYFESLICQKSPEPMDWSQKLRQQLRQQFQPQSLQRRSRPVAPALPSRLECPPGFGPVAFAGQG
jgi:hypothetical protein